MDNANNFINDWFDAFQRTSEYKDRSMMEIMVRRAEFEKNLDDMWAAVPKRGMSQMMEYRKGVERIKSSGLKVLRNPEGKHKIVHKN